MLKTIHIPCLCATKEIGDVCTQPNISQGHPTTVFCKGRTIRKVMGGGGEEFSSRRNFFSLSNSLYEFFLGHSMNIFED